MKIISFKKAITYGKTIRYYFEMESENLNNHDVSIEVEDGIIIETYCDCKGFFYRKTCRHIEECMKYLKEQRIIK